MEQQTDLLQTLVVAQILTLAKAIKAEKQTVGHAGNGRGEYVQEAIALTALKRTDVLQMLADMESDLALPFHL
ncbi:hypothetical protein [Collimonas sp.]|uniref:hypothetical protein n=1 Tax=Collimonas sp. TaxID=1963772 RepID=UPI002C3576C4|nr:hypothetical protein [Collimonas sp.]HWW08067.1 hypothetical protein [Collimonas sp.]